MTKQTIPAFQFAQSSENTNHKLPWYVWGQWMIDEDQKGNW